MVYIYTKIYFLYLFTNTIRICYPYSYLFSIVAQRTIYTQKEMTLFFLHIFREEVQPRADLSRPRGERETVLCGLLWALSSHSASCPLQLLVLSSLLSSLEVYQAPWLTVAMANEWQKNVLCRWVCLLIFIFWTQNLWGLPGTCIVH